MFGASFFYVIGIYAFLWWFFDNFNSLFQMLWNSLVQLHKNRRLSEQFGSWAVVTGSTDGIGKEYAKQLAEQGVNVVLIARNVSKLIQISNEIESRYGVQTKRIVTDFSNGRIIYNQIKNELSSIPVGILVNNVGHMYEYPDELANVPNDIIWSMILTNVGAVTMMSRLLVNDMKKRMKGAIVNISSFTALQPLPYGAVYAASKSYVTSFSTALRHECDPYGIRVQLVSPCFVLTKMNNYSKTVRAAHFLIPNAESFAKSAIRTLGKTNDTSGHWSHAVQYAMATMVPQTIRTFFLHLVTKYFRQEYLSRVRDQNRF